MSTGPTSLPESGPPGRSARRRWFPRLRDTRIRSKLALILVVPVVAVLALATVRLVDVGQTAYDANMIRSLTVLAADVSGLVQDVHSERMAAAGYLATDPSGADAGPAGGAYNEAVRVTDGHIAAYTRDRKDLGGVPDAIETRLAAIDEHLATLNSTRQEVLDRKEMPIAEAVVRYGVILTDLVSYGETLGQIAGEGKVAESLRAVAAFAKAKAAVAEEEAVAYTSLSSKQVFGEEQLSAFLGTLTSQQEALLAFALVASAEQQAMVNGTVTGDAVELADRIATEITRSVGQTAPLTAADAADAVGAVNDLMRWTEVQMQDRLLEQADEARSAVLRQAIIESSLVLLTLIVAIALAIVLARSLNESLRRLREGALSVANHDLPDAVKRLRDVGSVGDGGVEEIVRQVRDPIRLTNRDEVGQVAQAFNVVHKEAVRVAAEQAALRTSVSAMFLNLARRSQALVDRMIGELDSIERGEEDPKRLARLFELDHLATRMRRNDENLLVLAGADSAVPRRDDALLVDALRAAQSEVEHYNRIEFGTIDTDIAVAAHAVNDVVRLTAELLDNATRFSPPTTIVVADARRIRDYVLIQVEDRGLGLSDEQLEALNRRLSAPPTVDVAAFRLMGLAVVSRLASRYGIRVELRRNIEGGTIAQVTLPNSVVVLPQPARGGREPLPSRPRQLAVEPGPAAASSWRSESSAPTTATRTAAATLDQWQTPAQPPNQVPAQWQPPVEPIGTGFQVNAAAQQPMTLAPPVPPYSPTPASTSGAPYGTPTMAYPTVAGGALPQRGAVAGSSTPTVTHVVPPTPPGLPAGPVAGLAAQQQVPSAAAAVAPQPEETGDSPIFREMETAWFRTHGQDATAIFTMPTAGHPPAPAAQPATVSSAVGASSTATAYASPRQPLSTPTPAQSAPTPPPYTPPAPATTIGAPAAPASTSVPRPRTGEGSWRTAADEGWALASRAAEPANGGQTRSGLPKRVPQAQLVPGGVEQKSSRDRSRRTPDEVRGLLSAYHRGVQRGRTAGSDPNGTTSTKETSG
ncbi:nitrate- and nitrite sensing domain-containing protein [Micromonospora sp. NPDC049559]|uniref:sensor histidine kinase n=1 Tax=Micromonospora sp. NPDC049559 TaxID=3155923 RepID=UPI0034439762